MHENAEKVMDWMQRYAWQVLVASGVGEDKAASPAQEKAASPAQEKAASPAQENGASPAEGAQAEGQRPKDGDEKRYARSKKGS